MRTCGFVRVFLYHLHVVDETLIACESIFAVISSYETCIAHDAVLHPFTLLFGESVTQGAVDSVPYYMYFVMYQHVLKALPAIPCDTVVSIQIFFILSSIAQVVVHGILAAFLPSVCL